MSCCAVPSSATRTGGLTALEAFLHEQVWNGVRTISCNLDDYGVTSADLQSVLERLYMRPDMFALKNWNMSYFPGSSVYKLTPGYDEEVLASYDSAKRLYTNAVNEIVGMIDPSWTDLEKALFVHDYLALHYQYDTTLQVKDAYRLFRDGKGICHAYTMAVKGVMEALGIPCSQVQSASLDHTWNIVKLGGNWYHLDVTWDDPLPDMPGWVNHAYFLRSTQSLKTVKAERAHFARDDWQYGENVTCDSTQYDNALWTSSISRFAYDGKTWYYVREDGVYKWDGRTQNGTRILSFEEVFKQFYPRSTFSAYAVRAGLYHINGYLLFNTAFQVLLLNLSTGEVRVLKEYVSDGGNVSGFSMSNERLTWQVVRNGQSTEDSCAVPSEVWAAAPPEPEPSPEPTQSTTTQERPPEQSSSVTEDPDLNLFRGTGNIPLGIWLAVLDVLDAMWGDFSGAVSGGVSALRDGAPEGSIRGRIGAALDGLGKTVQPLGEFFQSRGIRPAYVILSLLGLFLILKLLAPPRPTPTARPAQRRTQTRQARAGRTSRR